MDSKRRGCLFVISGPSGVGKGTLVSLLRENYPGIILSTSATTRTPRPGEISGIHYFFIDKESFQQMIKRDEFLEWTEFAGNYYGTDKNIVKLSLEQGYDLILEIDVNGALQVKEKMNQAVLIFIEPPSFEELRSRLFKRRTESEQEIQSRLAIVKKEIENKSKFDYVILNKNLHEAFLNLEEIVLNEINKVESQI
jgi:guanylate kinase